MSSYDTSNINFQRALQFVNQTNRSLFLTGKAGTGKTTFLHYIREKCIKKMAVVAPTGVAAINAGGTTIHSFFQLPFAPYVPTRQSLGTESTAINEHALFKNLRLTKSKRELMQELDLLVIDEVSMMRADTLDAIDTILKHVRRQITTPFGGVQVLFIGDLFQLPPVVNDEEWGILQTVYKSPFFFEALVLRENPPVYLELKKIYRQNETGFIQILNNIRNNKIEEADLNRLHTYYRPGFEPSKEENFIMLTTHNARADMVNRQELEKLPGKHSTFEGELTGEFNEKALPADKFLKLKPGAQIMFTKNDKGEVRRYYNGKIGVVSRINNGKIFIQFPDTKEEFLLEKETWRNIRYQYNKEKNTIEEKELGTFIQYPIRLAWAITIHKSQGLTFSKAIIDAGASFAPGQVYVALSRLTSLEGLILYSRIFPEAIHTDSRVLQFAEMELSSDDIEQTLQQEQNLFLNELLLETFRFEKVLIYLQNHYEIYALIQIPEKNASIKWAEQLLTKVSSQLDVSNKFQKQLHVLITDTSQEGLISLHKRIEAASIYFSKIFEEMLGSLRSHANEMRNKKKVKKYLAELGNLEIVLTRKKKQIDNIALLTEGLISGTPPSALLESFGIQNNSADSKDVENKETEYIIKKTAKGDSQRMSLALFREGKNIREIARTRELAISTIESHLAGFIPTGEVEITELVPKEKIAIIQKAIEEVNVQNAISPVKEKLGESFSHGEIRAVIAYMNRSQNIKENVE